VDDLEDELYTDDTTGEDAATPITMAISLGCKDASMTLGIALLDLTQRTLQYVSSSIWCKLTLPKRVCEFEDDAHLSNVEWVAMQTGAKEVLLPDNDSADILRLHSLFQNLGILITPKRQGFHPLPALRHIHSPVAIYS
jgi:hypothetical protein